MKAVDSPTPLLSGEPAPPQTDKGIWRDPVIWLLVIAAFALRVGYNLALHPDGHLPPSFVIDEREYFGAAHMLAEGRGFSFFDTALWVRPPLYVTALAAVMKVAGSGYLPALAFQSLLSALTLLPLGWLAFRLGGRCAARFAVLIGLLYLPLTLFAGLLLSETLFVFLFTWTLVALARLRDMTGLIWTRSAWVWMVLSGGLLGLSVLTRANALAFVPLVALWLVWGKRDGLRTRLLAAGIVVGVCVVCLLPWIARNYSAYKRFVLIDTTSGYNLWLASVGVRDEPRLQAELLTIENPADRQGYAYARARENITADPPGFMGKGIKESFDLWKPLFGAEERQIKGYALGRVPDWHLWSLLLFDDLLYVVILVAAVAGLMLARPDPLKSLTLLWAALWVVMSFVFFAVTRFRLPVVVALLPWAGVGLDALLSPNRFMRLTGITMRSRIAGGLAIAGVAVVVVPAISIGDTWLGIERWTQQAPYRSAEASLRSGQLSNAIEQYRQANPAISDTRYGLAAALLQSGQRDEALAQLTSNEPDDRFEPLIIRGQAERMAGNLDAARSFFNSRTVQINSSGALDWAWDHLSVPATRGVGIGSGLDMGYVRGFYAPEKDQDGRTFRWSSDHAEIRGLNPQSFNILVWSGWRPEGLAGAAPMLSWRSKDGSPVGSPMPRVLENSPAWVASQPDKSTDQPVSLGVSAISFIGGGNDPRLLGVRISMFVERPLPEGRANIYVGVSKKR